MKFDIHYLYSAKYAKWIIISLISLLSLLIIWECTSLFISLTHTPVIATVEQPQINVKPNEPDFILGSKLFGVYVPNDLNEGNVKKSMLNVTLVGVLLGNKVEDSQVIIRSANGEEKTYKINDKIPGDAVIKRIMGAGVLVEHNGTLESLSLPKNDLTFEPVAKPLKED